MRAPSSLKRNGRKHGSTRRGMKKAGKRWASPAERPAPATQGFTGGDVVLAFHGSLLYEARVISVGCDAAGKPERYVVHFQGWKKTWDEDVPVTDVYEHNDENLRIAHRLLDGAKLRQQAVRPVEEKKKERKEEEEEEEAAGTEALFVIPGPLKTQLVDDWEFVTKEYKLVKLPREPSVTQVLEEWVKVRRNAPATREVAEALKTYFNAALPTILLYRTERMQYMEYCVKDGERASDALPADVYGAEHLLRLLLKMPYLLDSSSGVDREMMVRIAERVNDLAKHIQKNGRILLMAEYESVSEDYLQRAQQMAN